MENDEGLYSFNESTSSNEMTSIAVFGGIHSTPRPAATYFCTFKNCGQQFINEIGKSAHEQVHRANSRKKDVKSRFERKDMSTVMNTTNEGIILDAHNVDDGDVQSHPKDDSDGKLFECKKCDKKFTRRQYLMDHVNVHNGVKPHKCIICGKSFTRQSGLLQHFRTHTGHRKFVCLEEGCGKTFAQYVQLEAHTNKHTGERPYPCDQCNRRFRQSSSLPNHARIHDKKKQFVCPTCLKSFAQKHNWKKHMLTHTVAQPNQNGNGETSKDSGHESEIIGSNEGQIQVETLDQVVGVTPTVASLEPNNRDPTKNLNGFRFKKLAAKLIRISSVNGY